MKVVILTADQGNQRALCHKIAEICDLAAIVVSENIPRKKPSPLQRVQRLLNRGSARVFGRPFVKAWFEVLGEYDRRFPRFPNVPIIEVRNVNDEATISTVVANAPALTVVSGTNLVGSKVIDAAENRIVNMHTGISPYVKGGPNCTNWCLAKGWFHLIGNTVMWLDIGIDSGKIIATERTVLDGTESLSQLHWKVMEHAHDLYVRSIDRIIRGKEVPAIEQGSICEGRTFYTSEWRPSQMRMALKNFETNYPSYFTKRQKESWTVDGVKLISLTNS